MATPTLELLVRAGLSIDPRHSARPARESRIDAAIDGLTGQFTTIAVGLLWCFIIAAMALVTMTMLGSGVHWLPDVPIEQLWVANVVIFIALGVVSITAVTRLQRALSASLAAIGERGQELETTQEILRELATTDELTALLNRRTVLAKLDDELARSIRYERPLSVIMLDLDHFKEVNDTWGHAAGDEVLRCAADVLHFNLRQQDLLGRAGGEEFVVVLPETEAEDASALAERLRAAVAEIPFEFGGEPRRITVSAGVATLSGKEPANVLLARADAALYESKRGGRNRVEVAAPVDAA